MRSILLAAIFSILVIPGVSRASECPTDGQQAYRAILDEGGVSGSFARTWLPLGEEITLSLESPKTLEAAAVQVYASPMPSAEGKATDWVRGTVIGSTVDQTVSKRVMTLTMPQNLGGFFPTKYTFIAVGCAKTNNGNQLAFGAILTGRVASHGLAIVSTVVVALFLVVVLLSWPAVAHEEIPSYWRRVAFMFSDFNGRLSLSRVQLFFFTVIVILTATYVLFRTGELGDLSEDILLLLGIAGGSTATASVTDNLKQRLSWDNWLWLKKKGALKDPGEVEISFGQLVTTNNQFDIFRFQTLFFSIFIGLAIVLSGLTGLGTFEIPDSMLGLLGLSQVTYIGGKVVAPPTMSDFDKQLTDYRKLSSPRPAGDRKRVKQAFVQLFGYEPKNWV